MVSLRSKLRQTRTMLSEHSTSEQRPYLVTGPPFGMSKYGTLTTTHSLALRRPNQVLSILTHNPRSLSISNHSGASWYASISCASSRSPGSAQSIVSAIACKSLSGTSKSFCDHCSKSPKDRCGCTALKRRWFAARTLEIPRPRNISENPSPNKSTM